MFTGLVSPTHLLVVLAVVLLLFGAKRLPGLGRGLGQGLQEFKEGLNIEEVPEEEENPEAVERKEKEPAKP
jgi:sec-independent protein translocase protein TatA